MSDWTPTTIGAHAASVADYAKQIDQMLWHYQQYGVDPKKRDDWCDDMTDRLHRLDLALDEFKQLNTADILASLQNDLPAVRKGVL